MHRNPRTCRYPSAGRAAGTSHFCYGPVPRPRFPAPAHGRRPRFAHRDPALRGTLLYARRRLRACRSSLPCRAPRVRRPDPRRRRPRLTLFVRSAVGAVVASTSRPPSGYEVVRAVSNDSAGPCQISLPLPIRLLYAVGARRHALTRARGFCRFPRMRLPSTSTNRRDRGFLRLLTDVDLDSRTGSRAARYALTPGGAFEPADLPCPAVLLEHAGRTRRRRPRLTHFVRRPRFPALTSTSIRAPGSLRCADASYARRRLRACRSSCPAVLLEYAGRIRVGDVPGSRYSFAAQWVLWRFKLRDLHLSKWSARYQMIPAGPQIRMTLPRSALLYRPPREAPSQPHALTRARGFCRFPRMRLPSTSTNRRDRGFLRLLTDVDLDSRTGIPALRGTLLTPGGAFEPADLPCPAVLLEYAGRIRVGDVPGSRYSSQRSGC